MCRAIRVRQNIRFSQHNLHYLLLRLVTMSSSKDIPCVDECSPQWYNSSVLFTHFFSLLSYLSFIFSVPRRAAQGNSPKEASSPWTTLLLPTQETPHWSAGGKSEGRSFFNPVLQCPV